MSNRAALLTPEELRRCKFHICQAEAMEVLKNWLGHPTELYNLIWFRLVGYKTMLPKMKQDSLSKSLQLCYQYLSHTSPFYGIAVQLLSEELRHAVCIFYLVLRALDTVEDDMTISLETKIPILRNFHSYLYQPDWQFMGSNGKDKEVLENFPTISLEFHKLAKVYQDVIVDTCLKMSQGMAEFLEKKVESIEDWEKYSHYVSGLVGIGLSQLFSASKLEDPIVGQDVELANSLGLLMQKTNSIRDYHEDQLGGREYWPKEVWGKYVKKMSDLAKPENIDKSVQCMNELITNALHHIPDILIYLSRLKNPVVFNFCAFPQVRAIALLAAFYNNPQVFQKTLKIRKGEIVTLMMNATNMQGVKAIMYQYMEKIYKKIPSMDPSSCKTQKILTSNCSLCSPEKALAPQTHSFSIYMPCLLILGALAWQYLSMVSKGTYT